MPYGTINADVIGTSVAGSNLGAGNASIMKNRLINSDMRIDQRNAGASVTLTASAYTLDRWYCASSVSSKYSVQQNAGSITPPAGFTKYLGVTSLSAYSSGSSDNFNITQTIEGFNIADLGWGTANAKTITLSFQVYSSLTGTFSGSLSNGSVNRSYPFTFTISSASTWTTISVTIAGDTTGTWATDNSAGLNVIFNLGCGSTLLGTAGAWAAANYKGATGSVSVVGTNGATFYITGVQLEVGSSATGFEYRQYQQELALCQRYYFKFLPTNIGAKYGAGFCNSSTSAGFVINFPVQVRTNPTALEQSGTAGDYSVNNSAGATTCSSVPTFSNAGINTGDVTFTVASGLTTGQGAFGRAATTTGYLAWSAEL